MFKKTAAAGWKLGAASKIGFFLLTWTFVTLFGLPAGRLDTTAMANETLVWRLLMFHDVTMRGLIKLGMPDGHPKNAENVSKMYLADQQHGDCGGEVSLEGPCDDSIPILANLVWFAYAVLMILELYILIKLNPKDERRLLWPCFRS